MWLLRFFCILGAFTVLTGCADVDDPLQIFVRDYSFVENMQGWEPGFTNYPVGPTAESDTVYEWTTSYTSLENIGPGILMSCKNVNSGIFMFLKRKVEGLEPNTNYSIVFDIHASTNATQGLVMVLKAGASELEPKKVIDGTYYSLNIDKGESYASGENLFSLGDIGGISPSTNNFVQITRSNAAANQPFEFKTNSRGELWLVVGTDCITQGFHSIHYSRISVVFSVSHG